MKCCNKFAYIQYFYYLCRLNYTTAIMSIKEKIEEENNNLYDVFGEQLEKMEESNVKLSNEVQRLTAELQGLRMRYSDKDKSPVLYLGDEREFYTDEIKEIIKDAEKDNSETPTSDGKSLYRVQVGAYSVLDNAVGMMKKLWHSSVMKEVEVKVCLFALWMGKNL